MRVLVVDDSQMTRAAIREALRVFRCEEILEAENGEQAIAHLGRTAVDLVITDWTMPVIDGLTLLEAIRCARELRDLPVLMVTSIAERDKIVEALRAGISAYVVKPFAPATLQQKIAGLIAGRPR